MRSSSFFAALLAVSTAASSLLPRQKAATAPPLRLTDIPSFDLLTLPDAIAGLDLLEGVNQTLTQVFGNLRITNVQTASAASCSQNPGMRFEWRSYSGSDRTAFMNAIKCLIGKPPSGNFQPAKNRYEDLARMHQIYMPNIHQNAKFLLWHRYFLWTFEQVLRSECGFNRAFPWWDETLDAGKFAQSDMFTNTAYFGRLLPANSDGSTTCITSGAFGGLTCNIGPGTSNRPHCLSRAVNEQMTSQCNKAFVNQCNSRGSFAEMASCAEGGPHGYGHNGIGAVMADVSSSPSDPIFYMHHSFIDRNFRVWQNGDSVRVSTINGNDATGRPLSLDTMLYMGGVRPDVRVRDILNTLGGTTIAGVPFCYRYNY